MIISPNKYQAIVELLKDKKEILDESVQSDNPVYDKVVKDLKPLISEIKKFIAKYKRENKDFLSTLQLDERYWDHPNDEFYIISYNFSKGVWKNKKDETKANLLFYGIWNILKYNLDKKGWKFTKVDDDYAMVKSFGKTKVVIYQWAGDNDGNILAPDII